MLPVYYSDSVAIPLPPKHPFPQAKYLRLRERVEGLAAAGAVELTHASEIDREALLRVHSPEYVAKALEGGLSRQEERELGFPWSPEYASRARRSVGATVAAATRALASRWAAHLAGGTHHAFRDRGRGFCLFNDVAVAIRHLRASGHHHRVLVVDLDVHQGDGTASLFTDDASVFTFSIHGARNYPLVKVPGDLDVAIADGTEDAEYLTALDESLDIAWERSNPQFVFYLAGADPLASDRYGRMALTKECLSARDRRVFERCQKEGVPLVTVMAGGYARNIEDTVDVYFATVRLMAELYGVAVSAAGSAAGAAVDTAGSASIGS
jgi:acetoin utilization deacetylase AcuC-like enzyme